MQIRCTYCQTMFPISRDEMLAALQHMDRNKQVFYDAHCPKCRRANRVERKKIEILIPNWKKVIKDLERETSEVAGKEAKANEKISPNKITTQSKETSKSTAGSKKAVSSEGKNIESKNPVKAKKSTNAH